MSSPEDHPSWANSEKSVESCSRCKNTITLWHCEDTGCHWCASCWANRPKPIEETQEKK